MAKIKITGVDFKNQKAKVDGNSPADLTITIDDIKYLIQDFVYSVTPVEEKEKSSMAAGLLRHTSYGKGIGGVLMRGVADSMESGSIINFVAVVYGNKSFVAECDSNVYKLIVAASPQYSQKEIDGIIKFQEKMERMKKDAPRVILEVQAKISKLQKEFDEYIKKSEEDETFEGRDSSGGLCLISDGITLCIDK